MIWDPNLLAVAASTSSQTTPALPGGILAWIICYARRRNAVGGWLLFYYWQLYSTLVLSAILFAANIQSYVPENYDTGRQFALLSVAVGPGLLLLLVQAVVATISIGVETPDMLKLLRWVLGAQVLAEIAEVTYTALHSPDNLYFPIVMLIQESLWLAYFIRSKRVHHVFSLQDWDVAVNSIYAPKLKVAT